MANAQIYNPETSVDVQRRLSEFFGKLSHAQQRALLLDYDGTLARFCTDADRATPYHEVPALLDRIRTAHELSIGDRDRSQGVRCGETSWSETCRSLRMPRARAPSCERHFRDARDR